MSVGSCKTWLDILTLYFRFMSAVGLLLFAAFTTELLSVVILSVLNLLLFFMKPVRRRSLLKGGASRDVEPDVIATASLLSSCI